MAKELTPPNARPRVQPGTERGAMQPARPGFWTTAPELVSRSRTSIAPVVKAAA